MEITTSPLVKTYTLQEFWDLPEPADRSKLELIKGVLYMTPPPDYPHDKISALLNQYLIREIERCGYSGEVFVPRSAIWVDDDTYLEPDLMYLSEELQRQMDPRHRTRADIVVEVISPSNAVYDRRTKSDTYRAMGVRELWLLDPAAKEIEVRSFQARSTRLYKVGDVLRSRVLSKIKIPLNALFAWVTPERPRRVSKSNEAGGSTAISISSTGTNAPRCLRDQGRRVGRARASAS